MVLAIQTYLDLWNFPLLLGNYQFVAFSPLADEWSFAPK
jgi:hypothetical protein